MKGVLSYFFQNDPILREGKNMTKVDENNDRI